MLVLNNTTDLGKPVRTINYWNSASKCSCLWLCIHGHVIQLSVLFALIIANLRTSCASVVIYNYIL